MTIEEAKKIAANNIAIVGMLDELAQLREYKQIQEKKNANSFRFFRLAEEVRRLDKAYWQSRTQYNLSLAKAAERQLDDEIERINKRLREIQAKQALRSGNVMKAAAAIVRDFQLNGKV